MQNLSRLDPPIVSTCTENASEMVLNKRDESYGDNGAAHLVRVLKGAPDVQKRARDATMLPQLLVDRNRKKQLTLGLGAFKRVK